MKEDFKKIEEIKQLFKEYVDENVTFMDAFPTMNISTYSPSSNDYGKWIIDPVDAYTLKNQVYGIGEFLDGLDDQFKKEVIAAILVVNQITLSQICGGYCLPTTEEILKVLPEVKKSLSDRTLEIKVIETEMIPRNSDKNGRKVENYGEVTVIDDFSAYTGESPYYERTVIWTLPVFERTL